MFKLLRGFITLLLHFVPSLNAVIKHFKGGFFLKCTKSTQCRRKCMLFYMLYSYWSRGEATFTQFSSLICNSWDLTNLNLKSLLPLSKKKVQYFPLGHKFTHRLTSFRIVIVQFLVEKSSHSAWKPESLIFRKQSHILYSSYYRNDSDKKFSRVKIQYIFPHQAQKFQF